ncbi:MAG: cyclic pyranopterin monophosphate synthase MoaC [Methanomicrobiales archaeon]|jgi:cyclic pyranopterin phosphate synthase|nr:cyclic pyranopterin monophosphate synthase MoaC [Methanomicrobiales archaeon]
MPEFSHISDGKASMVDVSLKQDQTREAIAKGTIILRPDTIHAIQNGTVIKGNVLATARVAAVLAVKDTPRIIPMCHAIPVYHISVDFEIENDHILTSVLVRSSGKTGVEMEALVGVNIALLTIWDMVKSAEKDSDGQYPITRITDIYVASKRKI